MGISFKEVTHKYPGLKRKQFTLAIKDINLDISDKNEFVAIVGKTGSGKTTLVEHMNGLLLPSSGTVGVFDYVITPKERKNPKMNKIRKRIGFVFQFPEYQLFEETVLKDIMFAPLNFGFKEEDAKKRALEVAKKLHIEDLLNKSPFNLSGGQMRKVAIAGILSYDPDILLLDEPTRGLDPLGQVEIMELFKTIQEETGKTIILISHDMDLVYKYATRVVAMKNQVIEYDGNKEDLFLSNKYLECNLVKPNVLQLIDYLNDKLGYNIGYDTYSLEDLIKKLEGGASHE